MGRPRGRLLDMCRISRDGNLLETLHRERLVLAGVAVNVATVVMVVIHHS
ncbi:MULTISPECIES: hypothetical protein [unclassified Nocardioides]|nr:MULTISPECIES: hypothetical protein [unclassified Nocardioides]